jgi:hypothetical protein
MPAFLLPGGIKTSARHHWFRLCASTLWQKITPEELIEQIRFSGWTLITGTKDGTAAGSL